MVEYDTEHSRFSTISDRERWHKWAQCRANRTAHHKRLHHGVHGRLKKLGLPIFRDSTSDNAITYNDWRSDVDNLVRERHSSNLIRDCILSALEGRPRDVAKMVMNGGDGSLCCVIYKPKSRTTIKCVLYISPIKTPQIGNKHVHQKII